MNVFIIDQLGTDSIRSRLGINATAVVGHEQLIRGYRAAVTSDGLWCLYKEENEEASGTTFEVDDETYERLITFYSRFGIRTSELEIDGVNCIIFVSDAIDENKEPLMNSEWLALWGIESKSTKVEPEVDSSQIIAPVIISEDGEDTDADKAVQSEDNILRFEGSSEASTYQDGNEISEDTQSEVEGSSEYEEISDAGSDLEEKRAEVTNEESPDNYSVKEPSDLDLDLEEKRAEVVNSESPDFEVNTNISQSESESTEDVEDFSPFGAEDDEKCTEAQTPDDEAIGSITTSDGQEASSGITEEDKVTKRAKSHNKIANSDKEIDLFADYKVTELGWWNRYKAVMAVLAICFVAVVVFGVYSLVSYNISGKLTEDLGDRIVAEVTTTPVTSAYVPPPVTNFNGTVIDVEVPEEVTDPEESLNLLNVNFEELRAKYPDAVGWLSVPGAGINQPVAQSNNNEYYLTHNIDGTLSKSGWLFTDYRLSNELPVRNYVIYGHNMADGTAFGKLNRIRFSSDTWNWWEQEDCQLIYYTTEYYTAVYQIFNVMQVVSSEVYYHNMNLTNAQMIDFMTEMSSYNFCADKLTYSQAFKDSDRIITLSTCADAAGAEKLVIQGVLVYSKQIKDVDIVVVE